MEPPKQTTGVKAGQVIGAATVFLFLMGGVWLAYRNYVKGRGDRPGALRLSYGVFVLEMAIFLCLAHFTPTLRTINLVIFAISAALFISSLMWALYIALEPYVRRHWPQTIISWSRVLAGRVRDPIVGRDVLYGAVLGTAWVVIFGLGYFFEMRAGAQPRFGSELYLMGLRQTAALFFSNLVSSILGALGFFFILVLLRIVVKNRWLAAVIFVALHAVPRILGSSYPLPDTVIWVAIYGIAAFAVVRFGLIALVMAALTANVLLNVIYTLDFSNWYAIHFVGVVLCFVAITVWGFYTSLAGKPLWKDELFE